MAISYELEIPDPVSIEGWNQIPIEPSEEGLVILNDLDHSRIKALYSYYHKEVVDASHIMEAREGVAKRLLKAAELLPEGYKLGLYDTYRPLLVQASLFDAQKQKLAVEDPSLTEKELVERTKVYVSIPSNDPSKPSPHNTGGAVDLTILTSPDEVELDMGTPFDYFGIESQTAYFRNILTQADVHKNRTLLYRVMTAVGFTNYPEEWWHFDFGNQFWAKVSGANHAIYGIPDDYQPGFGISSFDPNSDHRIYRLRADGPLETFKRIGLAGSPKNLAETMRELDELSEPNWQLKLQIARHIRRRHQVVEIGI